MPRRAVPWNNDNHHPTVMCVFYLPLKIFGWFCYARRHKARQSRFLVSHQLPLQFSCGRGVIIRVNKRVCHTGNTIMKAEAAVFYYQRALMGSKESSLPKVQFNTVQHKILAGRNIDEFEQFVNIFP